MSDINEKIKDTDELEIIKNGTRDLKVSVDEWHEDNKKTITFSDASGNHIMVHADQIPLVMNFLKENL
jgi:hypothetical protein